jgi:putative flippase GtrA
MRRFSPLLALVAATLLLMAVAFADARPTVFYDSHSYDVMGRELIETVQDYPASIRFKMWKGVKWGDPPVPSDRLVDPAVMGARSPFYGVLMHGAWEIGTLWLLAAIQSFLAAWVIYLLWRTMAPRAPRWSYLALVAGSVIGTSVSFFTTFAMPDIFAGIGGAAMVLLLLQMDRLKRWEIWGLWVLCAYSMLIHKSHFATGMVIVFAGSAMLWLLGLPLANVARRGGLLLLAALSAWSLGFVADSAYEARTGYKLGHPPFIMARFLADGPARDYMRYACSHGQNYALCKFQANVGNSTDNILWSNRKKTGVFNIADRPTRQRLEQEETRFVIGAIEYDPAGQILHSIQDWGMQFISYQVDDPLRDPAVYLRGRYWKTTAIPKLIPNFNACRPPSSCKPPFDFDLLMIWHGVVLGLTALLLLWRLTRRDVRAAVRGRQLKSADNEAARATAVVLMLLAVTVVNAGVCGALSGPFARYQSRMMWLLPTGAGLVLCALPMGQAVAVAVILRIWRGCLSIWGWMRARPLVGRFLPPLEGHFSRFCVVGSLGFVVDFLVLKTVVNLGMSPIGGRLISFVAATTATWLTNRAWTFRHHVGPDRSLIKELATYFGVQSVGFAANFTVYTSMILYVSALHGRLLPPMVAGTATGLVINYLGAKHIVFRRRAEAS